MHEAAFDDSLIFSHPGPSTLSALGEEEAEGKSPAGSREEVYLRFASDPVAWLTRTQDKVRRASREQPPETVPVNLRDAPVLAELSAA